MHCNPSSAEKQLASRNGEREASGNQIGTRFPARENGNEFLDDLHALESACHRGVHSLTLAATEEVSLRAK
jgi:hypothetical protein